MVRLARRAGLLALFALMVPAGAVAAQRPRLVPHGPAPFGSSSRAACPSGPVRCFARVVTVAPGGRVKTSVLPAGYGPVDLQLAYGLAAMSSTGGAGETVAIVDSNDDPLAEHDLGVYRSTFGLSACTTANGCFRKVNQSGAPAPLPPVNLGWADEISLDLDMVSAVAPNAHILLVEGNSASFANLAAAENTAAALGATQISNSYGGDEAGGQSFAGAYSHPGVAITASTGDSGYYGDGTDANTPAAYGTVEAVGGTSLWTTSPRVESVWDGAGSGCSTVFLKPSWQHDALCPFRMVGDVSAVADPFTGVAVYDSNADVGGWAVFGGTSASAPIMAGFDALVGPVAADPSWPYAHPGVWNDVTSGSNGFCAVAYFCTGGPGYDGPTGLGTPDGLQVPPPPPVSPVIATGPADPTLDTSAQFTFSDATAGANLECSLDGSAFAGCSSPKSYTGLSVGAHMFRVEAVNAGGTSPVVSWHWTINSPPPPPPPVPSVPVITSGPANPTSSTSATFTFTDGMPGVSFLCSLDGSVFGGCSSPQTYATVGLGAHAFRVEASGPGGVSGPAEMDWTVFQVKPPPPPPSSAPPAPSIVKHPKRRTRLHRATFRFVDARAGVAFQCRLDGKPFRACANPRTFRGVKLGRHMLRVRAVDAAGVSSVSLFRWRVVR